MSDVDALLVRVARMREIFADNPDLLTAAVHQTLGDVEAALSSSQERVRQLEAEVEGLREAARTREDEASPPSTGVDPHWDGR